MWLPFYLNLSYNMNYTVIGLLATLYDIGGISGSILAGYISDKLNFRSLVVEVMIILSLPIIMMFQLTDNNST